MVHDDNETLKVFIENEAGSYEKKTYDERTLAHLETKPVSAAYPFAYGLVIGTRGDDGDAVDGEALALGDHAGLQTDCAA
jgi:inorganic pyrophosphatase